jgi:hypothetical protein
MSFKSLPIDQRPYKRFANLTPSDTTVYDPPTDAIMLQRVDGTSFLAIVGSDDVQAQIQLGAEPLSGIIPLSVKKVLSTSSITPIGLWRD